MRRLALPVVLLLAACVAAPARADLASLTAACTDKAMEDAPALTYRFCDDGVPGQGGRTPNVGAVKALEVPASYRWPDPVAADITDPTVTGLPPAQADAACGTSGARVPGSAPSATDPTRCVVALDANLTLPPGPPPAGGYPLVALMHGCCGGNKTSWESVKLDDTGEKWHYSNAWFATRGYAVLTYTARGFVTGDGKGSTGETQINSLQYEMNDLQALVAQLVDTPALSIDPARIVATGGSYGGGFSWLALVDPVWRTPGGRDVRLAAVAPKYGWTDLAHSLVPTGLHRYDRGAAPPATDGSQSGFDLDTGENTTAGIPIRSIISALYAAGTTGVPPGSNHATFPASVDAAFQCTQGTYPPEANPLLCGAFLETVLPDFVRYRSAYYWNAFFARIRTDASWRVPVFSAGTHTDPLFPPIEHHRMAERLRSVVPDYPIKEYYGDYQHFVQNKAKEWGDVCGADRHVCRLGDYPGGDLDAAPDGRTRTGATTLLNGFVDHYAKPSENAAAPAPAFDVTASLQVCPQNAGAGQPADEPGERFTARTYAELAGGVLALGFADSQTTTSKAGSRERGATTDPVANQAANGGRCPVVRGSAGPGVAVFDSPPLERTATMIGGGVATAAYASSGSSSGLQLNARLYDVFPDGTTVLVDRGPRRLPDGQAQGTATLQLHGNGWRFERGHRVRLELAQDDDPYLRSSDLPSSMSLSGVRLVLPIREASFGAATPAGTTQQPPLADTSRPAARLRAPRLASDDSSTRRFAVRWSGVDAGSGVRDFSVQVRPFRARRWRTLSRATRRTRTTFVGRHGATYRFRVRARDRAGNVGAWVSGETIVPTGERPRGARYRGPWDVRTVRGSFGSRLIACRSRRCRVELRYRGGTVYVLARTGPRAGRLRVTLGRTTRTVSLRRRRARQRQVVFRASRRQGRHVLRVRVVRGPVALDAFAIRGR